MHKKPRNLQRRQRLLMIKNSNMHPKIWVRFYGPLGLQLCIVRFSVCSYPTVTRALLASIHPHTTTTTTNISRSYRNHLKKTH